MQKWRDDAKEFLILCFTFHAAAGTGLGSSTLKLTNLRKSLEEGVLTLIISFFTTSWRFSLASYICIADDHYQTCTLYNVQMELAQNLIIIT